MNPSMKVTLFANRATTACSSLLKPNLRQLKNKKLLRGICLLHESRLQG